MQCEDCHFNVHGSYRVSFRTQCDKKLKQYGRVIEHPTEDQSRSDSQNVFTDMSQEKKRHSERVVGKVKLLCFMCNIKSAVDSKPYNEGGFGRYSERGSFLVISYLILNDSIRRSLNSYPYLTKYGSSGSASEDIFAISCISLVRKYAFFS